MTDLSSGFEPIDLVGIIQLIQIFSLAEAEHGYASLPPTFELDSPAVVSLVNGTKVSATVLLNYIFMNNEGNLFQILYYDNLLINIP